MVQVLQVESVEVKSTR